MALWRLKLDSPTSGTGTVTNPANVPADITPADNDEIAIDGGVTTKLAIPTNWMARSGLRIVKWDDKSNPIFSGAVLRTDWVSEGNGIWSRDYTALGNVVGCIREDDVPMVQIPWSGTALATLTSGPGGQYTFRYAVENGGADPIKLFIKPVSGTPAAHEYQVAERDYGLTSTGVSGPLTVTAIDFWDHARHGIFFLNRSDIVLQQGRVRMAGGKRDTSQNVYLGNGIELADGTFRCRVENWRCDSVFDSPFTSQVYTERGRLGDHDWINNATDDGGLAAVEIAVIATAPAGEVRNIRVDGLTVERSGVNNWSRNAPGSGRGVVYSTYNHAGVGGKIEGCKARRIRFKDVQRGWVSGRTNGVNSVQNMKPLPGAGKPLVYLASSNLILPAGLGQNDLWNDVDDGEGGTPAGSANSQFVRMTAPDPWHGARVR